MQSDSKDFISSSYQKSMMKELELDIYEEDNRVIIELEYKNILYTEEFNKQAEDVVEAAKHTTAALFDEIQKAEELRPYEKEEMERQIFLALSAKNYLTKEAIAELLDL